MDADYIEDLIAFLTAKNEQAAEERKRQERTQHAPGRRR
jgi:hypothetical protein